MSLYLTGLFLRFGVPLGLTIILAWLLRNMDLQWLEQADEEEGKADRIDGRLPEDCWVIHNLSKDNHRDIELQGVCWKVRVRFEGILSDQCLDCKYFQERVLENAA